jgi:hypothetical protein
VRFGNFQPRINAGGTRIRAKGRKVEPETKVVAFFEEVFSDPRASALIRG